MVLGAIKKKLERIKFRAPTGVTVDYEIEEKDSGEYLISIKMPLLVPIPKKDIASIYVQAYAEPVLKQIIREVLKKEGLSVSQIKILRVYIEGEHILVSAVGFNKSEGHKK